MTTRSVPFAALVFLVLLGCQGNEVTTTVQPKSDSPASSSPADPPESDKKNVQVSLASWDDIEKRIAAHSGKVVVIDLWSTWCAPCLKEFPNLVKLHQAKSGQVVCMSLNCNYAGVTSEPADSFRTAAEQFLQEQNAEFENFISTDPDEKLYERLGFASIPVVRVYDKQGKLRKQFTNDENEYGEQGFTYDQHIVPLVEKLVAEE